MRLTKRKLRALDEQLCIDAVLHEKFRRLNEDLQRRERDFQRRKDVARIYRKHENGILMAMQILEVQRGPDGIVVICA